MAVNSKVIWSEGMFLSPQHFQQQDRYFERYIENRCSAFSGYGWGVKNFVLDHQLLGLGKISFASAEGVFPDGTPFNFPDIDEPPPVFDLPENTHNSVVYLGIPLRRSGAQEVLTEGNRSGLARYEASDHAVHDVVSEESDSRQIQVGKLRIRLLLETDDLSGYACIGMMRVVEKKEDQQILLDKNYIVSTTEVKSSDVLKGFLSELSSMLNHRAESIAGRLSDARRAGTAEVSDYLLLQLINRIEPLIVHYTHIRGLQPEYLYSTLVQLAGELATFTTPGRRAPRFTSYLHDDLEKTFKPVIQFLRQCFSSVYEQSAISMTFVERNYGIRVAEISDRSLIETSSFILAVKAEVSTEVILNRFSAQTKLGPVERIRQLVNAQMPGIGLKALSVAPRQIPFHSGFTYFQLDSSSPYWQEMKQSGGFALHIGGEFPGLEIEFWAIRE